MKKIRELICKIFGHNFDLVELTIAHIERDAINAHELHPEVFCKTCCQWFDFKKLK